MVAFCMYVQITEFGLIGQNPRIFTSVFRSPIKKKERNIDQTVV